jgi:hypothetical protein
VERIKKFVVKLDFVQILIAIKVFAIASALQMVKLIVHVVMSNTIAQKIIIVLDLIKLINFAESKIWILA